MRGLKKGVCPNCRSKGSMSTGTHPVQFSIFGQEVSAAKRHCASCGVDLFCTSELYFTEEVLVHAKKGKKNERS